MNTNVLKNLGTHLVHLVFGLAGGVLGLEVEATILYALYQFVDAAVEYEKAREDWVCGRSYEEVKKEVARDVAVFFVGLMLGRTIGLATLF